MLWWHLPGPSRYVARVVEDLRDGKNVILRLPEYVPNGIGAAVREALGSTDLWSWCPLHFEEPGARPERLLYAKFVPNAHPQVIRNAHSLSSENSFSGNLIWVDLRSAGAWPLWKAFITDYAHACRSRSLLDRSLFCLCLAGQLALDPPPEDVCLSHQSWHGVVDNLDMLLYTSALFREQQMPDLCRRIATSIVAGLALWDPEVSERLVREEMRSILEPGQILRGIALDRGWAAPDCKIPTASWHNGAKDLFDGKERTHSAALAIDDPLNELRRRVWSAEVEVIFPLIEEKRQGLIETLAGILTHKDVSELQDMEIGQIELEISWKGSKVPYEIRRQIKRLKEMRNALAHLEPLSPELLSANGIKDIPL